jgi:hypothetical protein
MSAKSTVFSLILAITLIAPCHAGLMINEVVFNEVGGDVTGEWIEIFNTGPGAIDLTNYKIGDEESSSGTGTGEAMHRFPAGASIGSGELQIISVSASTFLTHYGVLPTYEVNSTNALVPDMLAYPTWDTDGGVFNMANGNDQAVLLDGTDTVIDAASWGSATFAFDPPLGAALDGQSYERINAYFDTDTADDWAPVADSNVPNTERSTPFGANVPEPASIALMSLALACVAGLRRR